jgi:GABA permease
MARVVKPEMAALSRTLSARHVSMISLGGIIGAGLFVGSSVAIASTGPAIIISYSLAGVLILCIMRMLAEMATAAPEVGSFTEYARFGLGPWAGFLCGWLYWYFWVVVVAIEAIAGARVLHDWLGWPVWSLGFALLALLTVVNLLSARAYGEFEFWFAAIKVAAILAFIALGVAYLLGVGRHGGMGFGHFYSHGGFTPRGPLSILSGITTVIFALCGSEIATVAAAESGESAHVISRMTLTVAVRIALFYVLSVGVIVAIVPWNEIQPGVSPFVVTLARMGIPGAAFAMSLIVLTAVLSCLNSGLYVTSRVLFVLAAHGDAPRSLVALSTRRVPLRAIVTGTVFGYCAVTASIFSPAVVFAFLVNASGALMLVVYLLIALSQINFRRRLGAGDAARSSIRMWGYPWGSYAVVAAITAVLVSMAFTAELAVQLYASLLCVLVVALCYLALRRRRGAQGFLQNQHRFGG